MDPRIPTAARLQHAKNYPAAEAIYQQILLTHPKDPDALLLLGLLLHETQRHEQAVQILRRAVSASPHNPDVRKTIINPLMALGQLPEAVVQAREYLRLQPMAFEAHLTLANLLMEKSDFAAALPYARRAVNLNPNTAVTHLAVARALAALKQLSGALTAADRALALDPKLGDAHLAKATMLKETGHLDQAITAYETGLKYAPKNLAGLNNLGVCYILKERPLQAIQLFEQVAALSPTMPKPRNNVGAALKDLGRIDESIPHFQQAAKIDPTYGDAPNNIGTAFASLSQHEKAIEVFRQALLITPEFSPAHSNLLMSMLAMPDVSEPVVYQEHLAFGRQFADPLRSTIKSSTSSRDPQKRLRVAYISPDFREHSIRYFIEPILANHDRKQFELICYAEGQRRDEVTARLGSLADAWHNITGLTDEQLAHLIRSHQVDILVDLAGHTAEGRLLVMARRPAPVQVTYLGYPATTGLSPVDYRLTDAIADPPENDQFYIEKLIRLPRAFFVYSDDPTLPLEPLLPVDRNRIFTFGSFNNYTKISMPLLDAWARILAAVPNSRLLMKSKPLENPSTQQAIRQAFARRGVAADRIGLRTWIPKADHRALLSSLDLMLDSYPYNGHTTSCQSLWAGVPVLTQAGSSFRSRVGASIMTQMDLPDFLCHTQDEYVTRAIELATDHTRIRQLRPTLRDRMLRSSLCDAPNVYPIARAVLPRDVARKSRMSASLMHLLKAENKHGRDTQAAGE